MAQRPGIQITHQQPADGGEHPNKYADEISVHIRMYWPPGVTYEELNEALAGALIKVFMALPEKYEQDHESDHEKGLTMSESYQVITDHTGE